MRSVVGDNGILGVSVYSYLVVRVLSWAMILATSSTLSLMSYYRCDSPASGLPVDAILETHVTADLLDG